MYLKGCFMQQRTERTDIILRGEGECMIWITGRFQMRGLYSVLLGYAFVPWRHSEFILCAIWRGMCTMPNLNLLLIEKQRHSQKRRGKNYWGGTSTFGPETCYFWLDYDSSLACACWVASKANITWPNLIPK